MKKKKIIAALILLAAALLISDCCYLNNQKKERAERILDQQEHIYDADGLFILIETSNGLMGIYRGYTPLVHIWDHHLKDLRDGVYELRIQEDDIYLYAPEILSGYPLRLPKPKRKYLDDYTHNGVPALVCRWE